MAGPVWRLEEGETKRCDECLNETTRVYSEGTVRKGRFHPDRRLCEGCYRDKIALLARRSA